jgi:hypothetical protein
MGAKGIEGIDVLEKISEKTEERLKIILNYYKKKGKIKKTDKYFNQHSLIIVLTLREIELIKEKLKKNDINEIHISQYNFKIKKVYALMFKNIDFESPKISSLKTSLENVREELSGLIDGGEVSDGMGISVMDNLCCPCEKSGYLLQMIIRADCNESDKFLSDYIRDNLAIANNLNYNYKNEDLENLKMVKYIIQLFLFMRLYIKFNVKQMAELTTEEKEECNKNVVEDNIILTHFLLCEIDIPCLNIPDYLTNGNEEAINKLSEIYGNLLIKIEQQKKKLINNSNNNN